MVIDQKKLARQKELFGLWLAGLKTIFLLQLKTESVARRIRAGIIEAVTGFGKTFIAIMSIKDMNERHPERSTIVVVPTTKLKEDWTRSEQVFNEKGELIFDFGHIKKFGLLNVQVFVVNTYVKYQDWECDLLILDEAHHYASRDAMLFSQVVTKTKFKFGMGLSATLSAEQKAFFSELGWNVVGTVAEEEAEKEGYTSRSVTFNLAVKRTAADKEFNEKIDEEVKYYFKWFEFDFGLIRACNTAGSKPVFVRFRDTTSATKTGKEWREWWAKKNNWDGTDSHPYSPTNLSKYAAQAMAKVDKRKRYLYNSPSKLPYIKALIEKFSNLKTIIFSESSDMADKISALFPETCLSLHSNLVTLAALGDKVIESPTRDQLPKLRKAGYQITSKAARKKQTLASFQDPKSNIKQMSTVRMVDEGYDVKSIGFVLQTAYSSTTRQDTQRSGRGKRIDYDDLNKKTLIVNLYMEGTQEEKWVKSKTMGKRLVRYVTSVDQINLNQSISLNEPRVTELSPTEVRAISNTDS